jgi:uncharacterized membrane protein YgcG
MYRAPLFLYATLWQEKLFITSLLVLPKNSMFNLKTITTYISNRSIFIGVITIVSVVALGASLALFTGFANPSKSFADFGDDGGFDSSFSDTSLGDTSFSDVGGTDLGSGLETIQSTPDSDAGIDSSDLGSISTSDTLSSPDTLSSGISSSDVTPEVDADDTSSDLDTPAPAPDTLQPCCTATTEDTTPAAPEVDTPTPAPAPDTLQPCCTATTEDTTPAAPEVDTPAPAPDTLQPCCTETTTDTPAAPVDTPAPAPDTLQPCCTTDTPPVDVPPTEDTPPVDVPPVTPPVVVPPVVPPPVVPPPVTPPTPPVTPQAECNYLTLSATSITAGQPVSLSWKTTNATSITIDNGVGTVTPTAGGSVTVTPTGNTTYTATVTGANNSVNCQASVSVVTTPPPPPPPTNGPSCTYLHADTTTINSGDAVTLTWASNDASSISIDNGVGTVTPTASGSVVVHPTSQTTYTATVPGAAFNSNCQVTVNIQTVTPPSCTDTGTCGGGGGGGGGGSSGQYGGGGGGGGVSGQIVPAIAPAPAAAYVSLTQIPYTGLDLGPIGTIVYWAALVIFCASASYLTLFNIIPFLYRRITSMGMGVGHAINSSAHGAPVAQGVSAHGAAHAVPSAPQHAPAPVSGYAKYMATNGMSHATITGPAAPILSAQADQGFKVFAQGSALTIDDIVKGLSRESGTPVQAIPSENEPVVADHQVVAVSEAHTNFAPAAPFAPATYAPAPARTPMQAAGISTDVRDFIAALLNGDRDFVFGAIRQIVREGGDAESFLTQVVCALDDAYRARLDGTQVNPEVARLTQNCAPKFLELLTVSLSNAVDSSYSVGISGAKLAVTRALAVVEG